MTHVFKCRRTPHPCKRPRPLSWYLALYVTELPLEVGPETTCLHKHITHQKTYRRPHWPLQRFGIRLLIMLLMPMTPTSTRSPLFHITPRSPHVLHTLNALNSTIIPDGVGQQCLLGREDPAEGSVEDDRHNKAKQPVEGVQVPGAGADGCARRY